MYTISQHYIEDSFLSKCIQRGSSNLVKTLMDKCGLLKQCSTTNLFHNNPKLFQNSLPEPPARCNQKYCPERISKGIRHKAFRKAFRNPEGIMQDIPPVHLLKHSWRHSPMDTPIHTTKHFPSNLKAADILPTDKKKDKSDIENYRPISILPTLSKIYERCMYDQMYKYFDQILCKYQCGFPQGFNTQHCLLVMDEKWKEVLDKGGLGGALLTDLSKAFDCIKRDLLRAKFAAYGFDLHSLSFVFSYLNERKQRTKIHNSYSPYAHIACGVPQGSILGPLLFNINI